MTVIQPSDGLLPGFADPVLDSQRVFRAILDAMSHPGTIVALTLPMAAPPPFCAATAAAALTLADYETALWLDATASTPAALDYLRFHCGCPLADAGDGSAIAIIADPAAMPPLAAFQSGSDDYPDRSTTLIIQLPALSGGEKWFLRGPGIADVATFAPAGLPAAFPDWIRDNHALFPCGVDTIFTCGSSLAALPRSTRWEI